LASIPVTFQQFKKSWWCWGLLTAILSVALELSGKATAKQPDAALRQTM
jgi:hypothetical protein